MKKLFIGLLVIIFLCNITFPAVAKEQNIEVSCFTKDLHNISLNVILDCEVKNSADLDWITFCGNYIIKKQVTDIEAKDFLSQLNSLKENIINDIQNKNINVYGIMFDNIYCGTYDLSSSIIRRK